MCCLGARPTRGLRSSFSRPSVNTVFSVCSHLGLLVGDSLCRAALSSALRCSREFPSSRWLTGPTEKTRVLDKLPSGGSYGAVALRWTLVNHRHTLQKVSSNRNTHGTRSRVRAVSGNRCGCPHTATPAPTGRALDARTWA